MSLLLLRCRRPCLPLLSQIRLISSPPSTIPDEGAANTHFKITLRRSALGLGERIKQTLVTLGIHKKNQTVYYPHTPEIAGKILKVKELVEVENVPSESVKTKQEMRNERKALRGYSVAGKQSSGLSQME